MVGYKQLTKTDYVQGVISQNRSVLARAITLVESIHVDHRDLADCVLTNLLPYAGKARRIGITGVPGVGKSTFIETLGKRLTSMGHRVAVLAVDPTSTRTGGSILGDKTRMQELARDPAAFIRPSPTSGTLGGVARATRESMVLCEAAGYDVILVDVGGLSGDNGLYESLSLIRELSHMFRPRLKAIVIKSACVRNFAAIMTGDRWVYLRNLKMAQKSKLQAQSHAAQLQGASEKIVPSVK